MAPLPTARPSRTSRSRARRSRRTMRREKCSNSRAVTRSGPTLRHSSGVNSATFKLFMDGTNVTSSATTGSTYIKWLSPTLSVGAHRMVSYGCARMAVVTRWRQTSAFHPRRSATVWTIRSRRAAGGEGRFGLLPGALPLPPSNLRGCPTSQGYPDIKMDSPASLLPARWLDARQHLHGAGELGQHHYHQLDHLRSHVFRHLDLLQQHLARGTRVTTGVSWLHTDPSDPLVGRPTTTATARLRAAAAAWRPWAAAGGRAAAAVGRPSFMAIDRPRRPSARGGGGIHPLLGNPGAIDTSSYWGDAQRDLHHSERERSLLGCDAGLDGV